jgi:hypothetical protein
MVEFQFSTFNSDRRDRSKLLIPSKHGGIALRVHLRLCFAWGNKRSPTCPAPVGKLHFPREAAWIGERPFIGAVRDDKYKNSFAANRARYCSVAVPCISYDFLQWSYPRVDAPFGDR